MLKKIKLLEKALFLASKEVKELSGLNDNFDFAAFFLVKAQEELENEKL